MDFGYSYSWELKQIPLTLQDALLMALIAAEMDWIQRDGWESH